MALQSFIRRKETSPTIERGTRCGRTSQRLVRSIAAALMVGAAVAELILGVRAEQRSLESIATPLTAIQEETGSSK